jgi:hypothetical protein
MEGGIQLLSVGRRFPKQFDHALGSLVKPKILFKTRASAASLVEASRKGATTLFSILMKR